MVKIFCAVLALSAVAVPVSLSNLDSNQTPQEPAVSPAVESGSSPLSAEVEPLPRSGNLPLASFPVQFPIAPPVDTASPAAQPTPQVQPAGFGNGLLPQAGATNPDSLFQPNAETGSAGLSRSERRHWASSFLPNAGGGTGTVDSQTPSGNAATWGVASAAAPQDPNAFQFQPQPDNQWNRSSEMPADNSLVQLPAFNSLRDPSIQRAAFQELIPTGQNPSSQALPPAQSQAGPRMNGFQGQANQPTAQLQSIPQRPADSGQSRESSARRLIGELERRTSALPMPGFPLTLEEALHQTVPESRRAMVAAYWQVWRDLQLWTLGKEEMDGIQNQAGPDVGNAGLLVEATLRDLALQNSQAALRQFFPGLAQGDYRPLPVDQPLVASYTTHYDWYAERGRGSDELARLDAALPVLLDEIERQAAMAMAGRDRIDTMNGTAQVPGQNLPGGGVSFGSDAAMAAFLETVCQYNSAVSHYTLTLIPNQPAPVELVRMLVPSRTATTVLVDTEPARVARMFEQANPSAGNPGQFNVVQPADQRMDQRLDQRAGSASDGPTSSLQQPSTFQPGFSNPAANPAVQPFAPPSSHDQGTQPYQPMQLPGFQSPGTSQPGANPSHSSFEPPRTNSRQPSEDLSPQPDDVPTPPAWQSFMPASGG